MLQVINVFFDLLAKYFEKIPFLNTLKGSRTLLGLLGIIVSYALDTYTGIDDNYMLALYTGFTAFTGLALNSKGRPD